MTYHPIVFNVPTTQGPLRQIEPIFVKLKFLKVEDIYKYEVSKFVFKCINRTSPVQFCDWFKLSHEIHDHSARSNFNANEGLIINNLFLPSARTTNYGLKQLKVNGPRVWNTLPSYLKNATVLSIFLKNLKLLYISQDMPQTLFFTFTYLCVFIPPTLLRFS